VFAETYEQHLRNVARLRQIEAGERSAAVVPPSDGEPAASAPGRPAPAPAARPKRPPATKKQ
jgi:UPF0755 protein